MMMNNSHSLVHKLGFPVFIRPSYVIGGKGMERINNGTELEAYLQNNDIPYPVLSGSIYASFRGRA